MAANKKRQYCHEVDRSIKELPAKIGKNGIVLFDSDTFCIMHSKYYKREASDSSKVGKSAMFGKMN